MIIPDYQIEFREVIYNLQETTKATGNITRTATTKVHTHWPTGELDIILDKLLLNNNQ